MSLRGDKPTSVWLDDFAFDAVELKPRRITTFTKESKIFGETMHYADPIMYSFEELSEASKWCYKTFGSPGYQQETMATVWDYSLDNGYLFWFGEEKYLTLFVLRWS